MSNAQAAALEGGTLKEMHAIQDRVGLAAFSLDYLIDNGAPSKQVAKYMDEQQARLTQAVAKITGGNPEDIAHKDKRTPEQERILTELAGKEVLHRWAKFRNSDYTQIMEMIFSRYKGTGDKAADLDTIPDEEQIALHNIALYFFATHKDFDPMESGQIGDADRAQIIALLDKTIEIKRDNPQISLMQAVEETISVKIDTRLKLLSKIPNQHVIPNNKLSNALTDNIIDTGSYELEVIGKGVKAIKSICILTYEGDNVKLTGRQPYTEYDRNVYNAVTSLYVYGDKSHIVTPATVYRAMVNMTEAEKLSDQQLEAVTHSLDKMRFIRARVDCTTELTKRGKSIDGEQITGGRIDTYLLAAEAVEVEAGGKTVKAYRIIKTPILYEYSKLIKQVLTLPAGLLDIKAEGQRVKNTPQRIAIKGYLLRRIEVMNGKTANKQSRHILFDAIYEAAGAENPTDKEKERIREYTFIVLDYWKDQGYIKGYERLRSGAAYTGIAIE